MAIADISRGFGGTTEVVPPNPPPFRKFDGSFAAVEFAGPLLVPIGR
jgi:hypothetical protein